jgi:hypothetical protein
MYYSVCAFLLNITCRVMVRKLTQYHVGTCGLATIFLRT